MNKKIKEIDKLYLKEKTFQVFTNLNQNQNHIIVRKKRKKKDNL